MKKILFIILLCLNIQLTYGIDYSPYSNHYSGYTRVSSERTYERIGYTSQYGGGFSNPKSTFGYPRNTYINPKSTFGKTTYDNYHSNAIYPGITYDNYHSNYSSGGGRPGGQPRRVVIHSGSNSIDTGLQDDYNSEWDYFYSRGWYYKDGNSFYYWNGNQWVHDRWIDGGLHWLIGHDGTASPSVPIGDGLVPLSLLCLGYILYRRRSNFFV